METDLELKAYEFAMKIDDAIIRDDLATLRNLTSFMEDEIEKFTLLQRIKLYYSLAVAYRRLAQKIEPTNINTDCVDSQISCLKFYKDEICMEKCLFSYRKSMLCISKVDSNTSREETKKIDNIKHIVYTQYANLLDDLGRTSLALENYAKVLDLNPKCAWSIMEIGICLNKYGTMMGIENNCGCYIIYIGLTYLLRALTIEGIDKLTVKDIEQCIEFINRYYPKEIKDIFKNDDYRIQLEEILSNKPIYNNQEEEKYRAWTFENKLFLDPLNDLPKSSEILSNDQINLPRILVSPELHNMHSQIKQEFIFARYLYYEALQNVEETHFADRYTKNINISENLLFSIRIEKMKTALRILYALLDKIAFFLNNYFELNMKSRSINFKSIWEIQDSKTKLKPNEKKLNPQINYYINAIYWALKDMSKSLFYNSESTLLEIFEIDVLRNALEHRHVVVSNGTYKVTNQEKTFHISEEELRKNTLEMFKYIREIIINLNLSVYEEERKKYNKE